MVIKLRGVKFGLKLYAWFQHWTGAIGELDLNHKCDNTPKFPDTKFNYYFITSILKSQNEIA